MADKMRTLWAIDLNGSPLNQFSGNEFEIFEDSEGKVNISIDNEILTGAILKDLKEGGNSDISDVKVNGSSVVENKVADIKLKTINNQAITGVGNINISGGDYIVVNNYDDLPTTGVSGGMLAYVQTMGGTTAHEPGFYQYKNTVDGWQNIELENPKPAEVTITGNFDPTQTFTFTIDFDDLLSMIYGAPLVISFTGGGTSAFHPDFFQLGELIYTSSAVVVLNGTQYIATINFDLNSQSNNATLSFQEIEGGSSGGGTVLYKHSLDVSATFDVTLTTYTLEWLSKKSGPYVTNGSLADFIAAFLADYQSSYDSEIILSPRIVADNNSLVVSQVTPDQTGLNVSFVAGTNILQLNILNTNNMSGITDTVTPYITGSGGGSSTSRTLYHIEVEDSDNHKAIVPIYKDDFDKFLIEMNQVGAAIAQLAPSLIWTDISTIAEFKTLFDNLKEDLDISFGCDLAMNLLVKYAYESGQNPVLVTHLPDGSGGSADYLHPVSAYTKYILAINFLGCVNWQDVDMSPATTEHWFKTTSGDSSQTLNIGTNATFTYTEEQVSGGGSSSGDTIEQYHISIAGKMPNTDAPSSSSNFSDCVLNIYLDKERANTRFEEVKTLLNSVVSNLQMTFNSFEDVLNALFNSTETYTPGQADFDDNVVLPMWMLNLFSNCWEKVSLEFPHNVLNSDIVQNTTLLTNVAVHGVEQYELNNVVYMLVEITGKPIYSQLDGSFASEIGAWTKVGFYYADYEQETALFPVVKSWETIQISGSGSGGAVGTQSLIESSIEIVLTPSDVDLVNSTSTHIPFTSSGKAKTAPIFQKAQELLSNGKIGLIQLKISSLDVSNIFTIDFVSGSQVLNIEPNFKFNLGYSTTEAGVITFYADDVWGDAANIAFMKGIWSNDTDTTLEFIFYKNEIDVAGGGSSAEAGIPLYKLYLKQTATVTLNRGDEGDQDFTKDVTNVVGFEFQSKNIVSRYNDYIGLVNAQYSTSFSTISSESEIANSLKTIISTLVNANVNSSVIYTGITILVRILSLKEGITAQQFVTSEEYTTFDNNYYINVFGTTAGSFDTRDIYEVDNYYCGVGTMYGTLVPMMSDGYSFYTDPFTTNSNQNVVIKGVVKLSLVDNYDLKLENIGSTSGSSSDSSTPTTSNLCYVQIREATPNHSLICLLDRNKVNSSSFVTEINAGITQMNSLFNVNIPSYASIESLSDIADYLTSLDTNNYGALKVAFYAALFRSLTYYSISVKLDVGVATTTPFIIAISDDANQDYSYTISYIDAGQSPLAAEVLWSYTTQVDFLIKVNELD